MAATKPPVGLHFIVSTDIEKPDAGSRKLIRSHVMLGKNRGRTLPSRKKKTTPVHGTSSSHFGVASMTSPLNSESSRSVPSNSSDGEDHAAPPTVIPRKFGLNASTLRLPATVEPWTVEIVLQFSSIAKPLLFPLEPCIFFERRAESWIAPLEFDPLYLHSTIFGAQFYFDVVLPGKPSHVNQRMIPHFTKTLKLLRERLEDHENQTRFSDQTACVIMQLAGYALMTNNAEVAKHHLEGLFRLISLRGGVNTFQGHTKLLVEILRCDMGMALQSGLTPTFCNKASSWEQLVPYPDLTPLLKLQNHSKNGFHCDVMTLFDDIDEELSRVWKVTSEFCSVVNFALGSKQRITTEIYLDTMNSILYRLLIMRFEAGSVNETVRIGLLAFSCSAFLQWGRLGMSYSYFTALARDAFQRLPFSFVSPQLQSWLLMVGAVSIFDKQDDVWLKPLLLVNVSRCKIKSWSNMQDLMQSYLWIGLLHNKPARRIFDSITT